MSKRSTRSKAGGVESSPLTTPLDDAPSDALQQKKKSKAKAAVRGTQKEVQGVSGANTNSSPVAGTTSAIQSSVSLQITLPPANVAPMALPSTPSRMVLPPLPARISSPQLPERVATLQASRPLTIPPDTPLSRSVTRNAPLCANQDTQKIVGEEIAQQGKLKSALSNAGETNHAEVLQAEEQGGHAEVGEQVDKRIASNQSLDQWVGFSDEGDKCQTDDSDTEGSDADFVDATNATEADLRRRSPKKHERTVVTDYLTGYKKKADLTFEEKVQIATALTEKKLDRRRKHLQNRLTELLSDGNVALAVMDKIRAANAKENVQVERAKTGAKKRGARRVELQVNKVSVEEEAQDDVSEFERTVQPVATVEEFDVVEKFLENRINGRSKSAQKEGGSRTSTYPQASDQPRFPHGYAPAVLTTNRRYTSQAYIDINDDIAIANSGSTSEANLMNYQPVRPTNLPPAGLTKPGYALKLPPARPTDPPPPTQINPPLPRQVNSLPRRPTNPPPARLASHLKQVFSCDSDEEALDDNNVTKKKRRQKGKKQPKAKAARMTHSNEEGEYFVLDGQHDDADDAEEAHDDGIKDHQLGFYQGELKRLVARAIVYMRLFLLNMEAYPPKEDLIKWAEKSFSASCQVAFGINYKDRMPTYTDGMSILLQNEGWGVRGKVKKAAVKLVHKFYNIYPPANKYARYPNADELETRHVEQRVKTLLGPESLYLRGYDPLQGDNDVPYAHPAIKELIHVLVFSKKASKSPLAKQDIDAFNPIPLPLIAYACTALLNALEEYRTGQHIKRDFSEADYGNYYKIIVNNLKEMEVCETFGPSLQEIREEIFESGCRLLEMVVHDEYDRPPAPFIPMNTRNTDF